MTAPAPSRRRRRPNRIGPVIVALAVIVVVVIAWLIVDGRIPALLDTEAEDGAPSATAGAASVPARPDDAFALTVGYVFDGDTVEGHVATPNAIVPTEGPVRVRLIGIDTPEGTPTPECWADEARAHLRELLPEGSTVWAAPDAEHRDRYDRVLLYLWTEDGRFVNHELVAAGDAEAMIVEPNGAHYDLLVEAEASARAAGAGQWGACG